MTDRTYNIEVRFAGGLTATQQAAFESAAGRWGLIITADVPRFRISGEVIDDVGIDAAGLRIDGPRGILGRAGPTHLRPGSLLPAKGVMEFGTATVEAIADGCRVLAMLWDSAWAEGNGQAIADDSLRAVPKEELKALYSDRLFLPSLPLDEISPILRLGLL